MSTRGFPFIIRYRAIDEVIVVIAVYRHHRNPSFGAERVVSEDPVPER